MRPTSSPRARSLRSATPSKPRPSTDLGRFEPHSPTARRQIDDLLARGATVLEVTATQVLLARDGHKARIDAMGRVEWLIQSPGERRPPSPPRRPARRP